MTASPGQGTPPPGADDERTPQQRAAEAAEEALLAWTATSWEHRARNVVRAIEAAGLAIVPLAAPEPRAERHPKWVMEDGDVWIKDGMVVDDRGPVFRPVSYAGALLAADRQANKQAREARDA